MEKLFVTLFLLSLQWSHYLADTEPFLTSEYGLHMKVFLMADKRLITETTILDAMKEANAILNSEVNVHLQVVGVRFDNLTAANQWFIKTLEIYESSHVNLKYDTAMILSNFSSYAGANKTCHKTSISYVDVSQMKTSFQIGRLIASRILRNNFYTEERPSDCRCEDAKVCLSDDKFFNTSSLKASSCYKDALNKLLRKELNLTEDSSSGRVYTHNCLTGDRYDPRDTFVSQETKLIFSIPSNGLKEKGEKCDCFVHDKDCRNYCGVNSTGAQCHEVVTASISVVVIVLVLGMTDVVIRYFTRQRHRNSSQQSDPSHTPSSSLTSSQPLELQEKESLP